MAEIIRCLVIPLLVQNTYLAGILGSWHNVAQLHSPQWSYNTCLVQRKALAQPEQRRAYAVMQVCSRQNIHSSANPENLSSIGMIKVPKSPKSPDDDIFYFLRASTTS